MSHESSYTLIETRDRDAIAAFLHRDPTRHLYELGDLDEPHWSRTRWFAAKTSQGFASLALLYRGEPTPTFLAMGPGTEADNWLMSHVVPKLPESVYAHVSEPMIAVMQALRSGFKPDIHWRMELVEESRLDLASKSTRVVRLLGPKDLPQIEAFYEHSYKGHWFAPEMMANGRYFGVFSGSSLLCVAGTHVLSQSQGVAALGNIATVETQRGQGLAALATATLCKDLRPLLPHIGLNVRSDNPAAIRCYEKIGFRSKLRFSATLV